MDMNNSSVVTKGKMARGEIEDKEGQLYSDSRKFNFG